MRRNYLRSHLLYTWLGTWHRGGNERWLLP